MTDQSMVGASNGTSSNNCGSGGGDYASNNGHNNNHEEYSNSNNNQQEQLQQNQSIELDETNKDIVRLIGQHLKLIGLEKTAQMLMQESGKFLLIRWLI